MKTTILTLAIAVSTLFGISQPTFAATGSNPEVSTTLTEVSSISEIEVHGNVQLYVTSGNSDQVKVYNNYYTENALVQDQNGVLRITSYAAEKLVVWVTVNDLAKLSAYDNSDIKSFGDFSAIELDVKLFDHASAKLNMDAFAATVTLNDRAKADISGNVTNGNLQYVRSSFLNTANLAAAHLTKTVKSTKLDCKHPTEFASL